MPDEGRPGSDGNRRTEEPAEPAAAEESIETEEPAASAGAEEPTALQELAAPAEPEELEELEEPEEPLTDRFRLLIANAWRGRLEVVRIEDLPVDERCQICQLGYYRSRTHPSFDESAQGMCLPRRLKCGHIAGDQCLNAWAINNMVNARNVTCPVCRTVLISHGHEAPHALDSWSMAGMM